MTTTYYPDSKLTVVLHGTPEGMQKALEEFSAREAAKEAKRAILHHQEHAYAIAHPEVYDFCMKMWFDEERKRNQAEEKAKDTEFESACDTAFPR